MNKAKNENDGQVIIFLSFVLFHVTVAFILFADGITISPEVGLRNSTQNKLLPQFNRRMDDSSEILIDGSAATMQQHQRNQTQIERHRRLIPYMTFYLPATNNDLKLPINQAYNFMPPPPPSVSNYYKDFLVIFPSC